MTKKTFNYLCCMALCVMWQICVPAEAHSQVLQDEVSEDLYVPADEDSLSLTPALLAEYEQYEAQSKREQRDYLNAIRSIWSADSILLDTPTKWVEYSKDFMSRTIVDFENGTVRVEVASAQNNNPSAQELSAQLGSALGQLLNSRGTTCSYNSIVDTAASLSAHPVMEGLVDLSRLAISSPNQQKGGKRHFGVASRATEGQYLKTNEGLSDQQNIEVANSVVEKLLAAGLIEEYTSPHMIFSRDGSEPEEDGSTVDITSILLELTESHLDKSAVVYHDIVSENAQKYDIDEALIFAVMEQESRFNPKATSYVPAYGLMQLVPKSGGLASYRFVYEEDKVPTSSFLYVPSQNVELGTALLRILMNQFKKVEDEACRRLCVIASYNTGAGNVSRSFTGKTKLADALPKIMKMSYNELYQHLTTNLGSKEARNYVKMVEERRDKYLTLL